MFSYSWIKNNYCNYLWPFLLFFILKLHMCLYSVLNVKLNSTKWDSSTFLIFDANHLWFEIWGLRIKKKPNFSFLITYILQSLALAQRRHDRRVTFTKWRGILYIIRLIVIILYRLVYKSKCVDSRQLTVDILCIIMRLQIQVKNNDITLQYNKYYNVKTLRNFLMSIHPSIHPKIQTYIHTYVYVQNVCE